MEELFRIIKVDGERVRMIEAVENPPHLHDYEELIVGAVGALEHFIDYRTEVLEAPLVSFVTKGKVHRVKFALRHGACDMWAIRFRSEFIPETIFQLYSLYHANANIQLIDGRCFSRLPVLCEMMASEMDQLEPDLSVVRQLLVTLLTLIAAEQRKTTLFGTASQAPQDDTFRRFLLILEENYRAHDDPEFYAEKLFMSARNLNLITHAVLQQSVSRIVETRKLIEAKNLLMTTDRPVGEIGFELGYEEKAYFSRVFKKNTGQTPTEFRDSMKRLVA